MPWFQILIVLGMVLFVVAGFKVTLPRAELGWFGAACIAAALLLTKGA